MKLETTDIMTDQSQRIKRIIAKHVHDVRNSMNCLYWEAALLGELNTDPEVAGTVKRICAELTQLEETTKALQYRFSSPAPLSLSTADLLDIWRQQIAPLETDARRISWSAPPVPRDITLDAPAMLSVMHELVLDAWRRSTDSVLKAAVVTMDHCVTLELREPSSPTPPDPEELEEQQRLVAIHGGALDVSEDALAGERIITLTFGCN